MEIYLTIEELAEYIKFSVQTIRRWILNREIPYCKIRKMLRFRLSDIEKWIKEGGSMQACDQQTELQGELFSTEMERANEVPEETE